MSGDEPDERAARVEIPLNAPDLLAVNALGQFADHPRIAALRNFITGFASDGTLKMLAYLVLLYDPVPPPFIGIEEPENFLHPRLLPDLAEE